MIIPIKTELILNFIKKNNLTKSKFCNICKINTDTLNRILSKTRNYRLSALFKIAKVIKIEVRDLFYDE